jgi:IMP dehydrogenase
MTLGLTFDDVNLIPCYSTIESRLSPELDLTTNITPKIKAEYPILASPMDCVCDWDFAYTLDTLGCKGIIHRFQPVENQIRYLPKWHPDTNFIYAIGTNEPERIKRLYETGAKTFCIDTANGHNSLMERAIKSYKDKYPDIEIMAGIVVTTEGAADLVKWGADSIRVGLGGGSCCSTPVVTGCRIPNLTALQLVCEGAGNASVIMDGGIRWSGDIVKSLVFGADAVMIGRLFAPFSNAGKITYDKSGQEMKVYRGQASLGFQEDLGIFKKGVAPEGISTLIPMQGTPDNRKPYLERFIDDLTGGIRSGMTYLNARNIQELRGAKWMQVSEASIKESYPRI